MTKGAALPSEWSPSRDDVIYGIDLGFNKVEIAGLAEDMRLWAISNAHRAVARKSSWQATFRGWMRREATRRKLKIAARPERVTYMDIAEELAGGGNGQRGFAEPDLFDSGPQPRGARSH